MLHGKTIGLIIPALNEAESVAKVIADVPVQVDFIVVVDNGSTDVTADRARQAGAMVIQQPVRGYGAACQAGFAFLLSQDQPDIIAFIDADYSDYPEDLMRIAEPLALGEKDISISVRQPDSCIESGLSLHQRAGNWLVCCIISLLHGTRFHDLGPMRCVDRRLLESMDMTDLDFGWTVEMQIKALRMNLRIAQIPVRYRQRIGKSKISGTVKGTIMAAYKMLFWTIKLTVASR